MPERAYGGKDEPPEAVERPAGVRLRCRLRRDKSGFGREWRLNPVSEKLRFSIMVRPYNSILGRLDCAVPRTFFSVDFFGGVGVWARPVVSMGL
jgi:hypothetical protein